MCFCAKSKGSEKAAIANEALHYCAARDFMHGGTCRSLVAVEVLLGMWSQVEPLKVYPYWARNV